MAGQEAGEEDVDEWSLAMVAAALCVWWPKNWPLTAAALAIVGQPCHKTLEYKGRQFARTVFLQKAILRASQQHGRRIYEFPDGEALLEQSRYFTVLGNKVELKVELIAAVALDAAERAANPAGQRGPAPPNAAQWPPQQLAKLPVDACQYDSQPLLQYFMRHWHGGPSSQAALMERCLATLRRYTSHEPIPHSLRDVELPLTFCKDPTTDRLQSGSHMAGQPAADEDIDEWSLAMVAAALCVWWPRSWPLTAAALAIVGQPCHDTLQMKGRQFARTVFLQKTIVHASMAYGGKVYEYPEGEALLEKSQYFSVNHDLVELKVELIAAVALDAAERAANPAGQRGPVSQNAARWPPQHLARLPTKSVHLCSQPIVAYFMQQWHSGPSSQAALLKRCLTTLRHYMSQEPPSTAATGVSKASLPTATPFSQPSAWPSLSAPAPNRHRAWDGAAADDHMGGARAASGGHNGPLHSPTPIGSLQPFSAVAHQVQLTDTKLAVDFSGDEALSQLQRATIKALMLCNEGPLGPYSMVRYMDDAGLRFTCM